VSPPRGHSAIDEYIAAADPKVRAILRKIRTIVKQRVPAATECISYRMPSFRTGRVFMHYAAFKQHVGVYPPVRDPALAKALAPYLAGKGNLQFPLDRPMPYALIGRIAAALAKQAAEPRRRS
jgi:uncharacterized protein YdhG (YjbR/CyaY superfamily)